MTLATNDRSTDQRALEIEAVSHRYGRGARSVVDQVSLRVEAGEIVCLFGPSGCGKTTLLRLVAGHERLQSGRIRMDGGIVADPGSHIAPERRPVGLVFQDYVLFPHMTVAENIGFGLRDHKRAERIAVIDRLLNRLGLGGFQSRYPHELSGGQQQRVALARAIARKPNILLLDEPLASVDLTIRRKLQEDIRAIVHDEGLAALFVTHDADEALVMGDRIALFNEGRLVDLNRPSELFHNPCSSQAALLFPGTQIVEGRVENGRFQSLFGDIAVQMKEGPALCVVGPEGFTLSDGGDFEITDCRFSPWPGADWLIHVQHRKTGARIKARAKAPLEPGCFTACSLNGKDIRYIDERNSEDDVKTLGPAA